MHTPRLGYANLGLGIGLRTVHFPYILRNEPRVAKKGTHPIPFGSIIAEGRNRRKRANASGCRRWFGAAFVGDKERRKAASAQRRTPPVTQEVNGA
jgi:hypothetical protein